MSDRTATLLNIHWKNANTLAAPRSHPDKTYLKKWFYFSAIKTLLYCTNMLSQCVSQDCWKLSLRAKICQGNNNWDCAASRYWKLWAIMIKILYLNTNSSPIVAICLLCVKARRGEVLRQPKPKWKTWSCECQSVYGFTCLLRYLNNLISDLILLELISLSL